MWIYPREKLKKLSPVFLTPNMDRNNNIPNSTESKYAECAEYLETFGCLANTAEHVVYTPSKVLTDTTHDFLFCSNLWSAEESKASNICLAYLCRDLYHFTKPLQVRDKQSESFISIDYKPPLLSREDKYFGNPPHDKIPGKTGDNNEPSKHRDPNSPNMPVLNEYGIIGGIFILPTQEDMEIWLMIKCPEKLGKKWT